MKKTNVNDEFLRKRKERQKRIRKRRLVISFIIFLILSLVTGVILCFTVLLPIKQIKISGSKLYTTDEIINACGIQNGDNLFAVSESEALEILKANLPFIETLKFKRTLPDTLEITVTEAKEFACYQADGRFYTVSEKGWVLESYDEEPENVFLIICDGVKCTVGSAVEFENDSTHEQAENIIELLQKYDISINNVNITDAVDLRAEIENRFTVSFGTSNDLESKIRHLKSMTQSIDKSKKGYINLSMWSSENSQGTFVEN